MFAIGRSGSGNIAVYMGCEDSWFRSTEDEEFGVEVPGRCECELCGW